MTICAGGRAGAALRRMDESQNCIFCRIVRGQAEASVIHQDEMVLAFLDAHPVATGHVLVVPRAHASGLAALDEASGAAMFAIGRRIALALRAGQGADGVNLHLADGEAAGQTVFHTHLHVIPRTAGDGFGLRLPHGTRPTPDRAALEATADRLRRSLARGAGR
jgi:diadenosine tetraphosphate (Ap4A) HIT family hydrolase